MMRTLPLSLALALFVPAIAVASPIDGRWAIAPENCTAPEENGDIGPFTFAGDTMTFFESECTLTKITPIGGNGSAWRAKANCSGEGEEWKTDWVLGMATNGDGKVLQLTEIDMKVGYVTVYWPCE